MDPRLSQGQLASYYNQSEQGTKNLNPIHTNEYIKLLDAAGIKYQKVGDPLSGGSIRPYSIAELGKMDLDAKTAAQKAETDARFASNKAELGAYNTKFGEAVPKIMDETYSKYAIPDQVGGVNALNSRIKDLQFNTSGSGAGGYASGAQVDKALQLNYLPNFNTAAQNLNNSLGAAQSEIGTRLTPYQVEGNLLSERIAREATGYSTQQQRELDVLLTQYQTGVQMAENEKNRMNQLAIQEKEFEQLKYQTQNKDKNTQIIESGGRKYLVDMNTGQKIQDLGATGSGAGFSGINLGNVSNPPSTMPSSGIQNKNLSQYSTPQYTVPSLTNNSSLYNFGTTTLTTNTPQVQKKTTPSSNYLSTFKF